MMMITMLTVKMMIIVIIMMMIMMMMIIVIIMMMLMMIIVIIMMIMMLMMITMTAITIVIIMPVTVTISTMTIIFLSLSILWYYELYHMYVQWQQDLWTVHSVELPMWSYKPMIFKYSKLKLIYITGRGHHNYYLKYLPSFNSFICSSHNKKLTPT